MIGKLLYFTVLAVLSRICTGCFQSELIKVLEFTYPPGSTDMPIREWATEAWLEHTNTLPTSLSVCTAVFLKSWVADWNTDLTLFKLEDTSGNTWALLWMYAGEKTTTMAATIGQDSEEVKVAPTESLPMYFPQSWMRVCMSLDMEKGIARIVANGKVLVNAPYPDLTKLKGKGPSKFTIRLGKGDGGINSKWTDLNMFTKPLDPDDMVAMTTSGDEKCGNPGDFLKWADMQWSLSTRWAKPGQWGDYVLVINASKYIDLQFEDGPCWRETKIHVYQIDNIHQHSYCMRHCQKIDNGRVPSLVSLAQWEAFKVEIEAVSPHTCAHCHLWMSATEGDDGTSIDIINSYFFYSRYYEWISNQQVIMVDIIQ